MKVFDQAIAEIMPTFCAIPFVSLMVNPDATVKPCCMMKKGSNTLHNEDGSVATIKNDFKKLWNSDKLKKIRIDMVSGNKVSGCEVCYLQEDSGRKSNRQQSNEEWAFKLGTDHLYKLMDRAIIKNGELDYSIAYLDLRLGNLCNLKCRMCSPWNSSQIAKEHLDLQNRDKEYKLVWDKSFGRFNKEFLDVQQLFEEDILWDQIIDLIPKLHKVYMTGGEPTLIENNFKFMQECINQGRKDIVLFFNTNCTNVNKKFTSLIEQFDTVYINASIDGIGEMNDYIRAPSKWSQVSANIEKLAQMPNVQLGITPTVQVYNAFDLVNILDWVDELNLKYKKYIFVDFLINVYPEFLKVDVMTTDMMRQAADKLIEYKQNKLNKRSPELTVNSVNGIIGLLSNNDRTKDWKEQIERLRSYTNSLDRERDQDLQLVNEPLKQLINEQ
jgi:MoaA/NifB/PqqE/SkfB family radical SAM enzyme